MHAAASELGVKRARREERDGIKAARPALAEDILRYIAIWGWVAGDRCFSDSDSSECIEGGEGKGTCTLECKGESGQIAAPLVKLQADLALFPQEPGMPHEMPQRRKGASALERSLAARLEKLDRTHVQLYTGANSDFARELLLRRGKRPCGTVQAKDGAWVARFQFGGRDFYGPFRRDRDAAQQDRATIMEHMSDKRGSEATSAGKQATQKLKDAAKAVRAEVTARRRAEVRARRQETLERAKAKKRQWTPMKKQPWLRGVQVRLNTKTGRKQLLGGGKWAPLYVSFDYAYSLQCLDLVNVSFRYRSGHMRDEVFTRGHPDKKKHQTWDSNEKLPGLSVAFRMSTWSVSQGRRL